MLSVYKKASQRYKIRLSITNKLDEKSKHYLRYSEQIMHSCDQREDTHRLLWITLQRNRFQLINSLDSLKAKAKLLIVNSLISGFHLNTSPFISTIFKLINLTISHWFYHSSCNYITTPHIIFNSKCASFDQFHKALHWARLNW